MSHHRALILAMLVSTASLLTSCAPAKHRWRWRIAVAATGALLGVGVF